jgi:hypothetical protein
MPGETDSGASEFLIQMSLTNKFSKLTVVPEPQTSEQNVDIDMEISGIPDPSQNKTADQKLKKSKKDKEVFTFVTVYYKHGEWGTQVYDTLREGLLEFVQRHCGSAAEREIERLVSLDDEELLDRMLIIGTNSNRCISWWFVNKYDSECTGKERIDKQIGHGLVGVVKGPNHDLDGPTVYLEMYYKHGEWSLKEGYSNLIDNAMDKLEREMGEDEWNELSEDEQMDAALEQSEEDVLEQRGWGVVTTIAGTIYATLE